ncbi:hypothetical protein [Achromobacter aegrifaciens]|uniref:hypothetical protein n=1 Tax=Achromobacter aegrifaciens TaxID=1287736 RepID=UPI0028B0C84B|nr:hypothetical protein [Achromobacter aegrifaciens]
MREISVKDMLLVAGGMDLSNSRGSNNIIDRRNENDLGYWDANAMCWRVGTPDSTMFPNRDDLAGTNYNMAGTDYN